MIAFDGASAFRALAFDNSQLQVRFGHDSAEYHFLELSKCLGYKKTPSIQDTIAKRIPARRCE
jgi:hypothetical protein